MHYSIKIKRTAMKEISRLDRTGRERVIEAIDQLSINPHIGKLLKGELSGLRRIRVGSFRVIYEINEGEVLILVLKVAHRRNVYRNS